MITTRYINLTYYHYITIFSIIFLLLILIIREQLKSPVKLADFMDFELEAHTSMNEVIYEGYSKDKKIKLVADSAALIKSDKIEFHNLKINMPQSRQKEIIIKANQGDYNTTSEIAILKGDVSVNLDDKNFLTTILHYEKKKDIVWTDKGFKLSSNSYESEGDYFLYNLKNDEFTVKNQKSIIKGEDISVP